VLIRQLEYDRVQIYKVFCRIFKENI